MNPFNLLLFIFLVFFIFAFAYDHPLNIIKGLVLIILSPDILITDYIFVAGLGAAIANSALVGIYSIALMKIFKCENKGTNIMAIWLMAGFAFFGKNPANITPIIFGSYLYARFQKKPFSDYLATALLATTLSPVVSQLSHIGLPFGIGLVLGILAGITLGFVIVPISSNAYKAHGGYNLYNVGFAAGIISIIITAVIRNAGYEVAPVALWSEGNNVKIAIFLITVSMMLIAAGLFLTGHDVVNFFKAKTYRESRNVIDDRYTTHGEKAYLNMGFLGICSTILILLLRGQLSGPIIGGIFTIIGFSCVGKNLFNIAPSMIGCILATLIHGWDMNSPGYLLTMLFSATLAPISSQFGFLSGVAAGFLHLNLTVKLSEMTGGLSLYNNGLAGGFVAMLIVPVINAIRERNSENPSA